MQGRTYIVGTKPCSQMTTAADREHAARHLLEFLRQAGPVEAAWAMSTALAALADLPVDSDYVAAAAHALNAADPQGQKKKDGDDSDESDESDESEDVKLQRQMQAKRSEKEGGKRGHAKPDEA